MSEPPRKRNRISKVCIECKRRKVKCDMKCPCSRCQKSGLICKYREYSVRQRNKAADQEGKKQKIPIDIIRKLEELQKEIDSLKRVSNDKVQDSKTLLDIKIPSLKRSVITYHGKASNFLGPSCRFWLMYKFPVLRDYIGQVLLLMKKEKKGWMQTHTSCKPKLDPFEVTQHDDIFVQRIVLPNIGPFRERILYFQNHLNSLIFRGCIPMNIVRSLFQEYSNTTKDRISDRPFDSGICADLSLIIGVVYITYLFTRQYDNQDELFHFHLSYSGNELLALFLKLLNFSRFRSHKTLAGFLSLLIFCQCLLLCKGSDETHRELDSYGLFQMCFNMCMQMGFHHDPTTLSTYSFEKGFNVTDRAISSKFIRRIWNFMQTEDTFYSIMIGTPLLIDYKVCSEFYMTSAYSAQTLEASSLKVQREVCEVINSRQVVSVNEIVDQIFKILEFCHTLPSTSNDINQNDDNSLDTLAFVCRQRLVYTQLLQCLCRLATDGLSMLVKKTTNKRDRRILQHLSAKLFRKALFAAVLSLYTVKSIIKGETIFQSELNGRYIVYFRDIISTVLGNSTTLWFTFAMPEGTGSTSFIEQIKLTKSDSLESIGSIPNVTLPLLEKALFETGLNEDENLEKKLYIKLSDPAEFIAFCDNTFLKNKVIRSSFESFVTAKYVIVSSYFLKAVEECKELLVTKQITVIDIMNRIKQRLVTDLNNETVNPVSNLKSSVENTNLEEILDSVVKEYETNNLSNTDTLDPEAFFNLDDILRNYQNM